MLSLGRALVSKPKLLMLDEPSLGLSPSTMETVFESISELKEKASVSILIVEQKVLDVLEICDRAYSIRLGRIAFDGLPADLREDKAKLKQLFL